MYVNTSGSLVRERVRIGPWTTLSASTAPTAKRLPVRRGQRGGLVFTIQRTLNNWIAKWRLPLEALNEDSTTPQSAARSISRLSRWPYLWLFSVWIVAPLANVNGRRATVKETSRSASRCISIRLSGSFQIAR